MIENEQAERVWSVAREFGIVGRSEGLYNAVRSAWNVAPTEVSVLILGANGTGKEQIARLIHHYSRASGKHFLTINCASISPHLFESQMFGHERGAFTGANMVKKGDFELAHGGTLFLDELGEMPLDQQAKLLRVMQTGRCRRVGSNSPQDNIEARPRIIAATNIDVADALRKGKLREDLFYRLTKRIELPPLSSRREDIEVLAKSFLRHFIKEYGTHRKIHPKSIAPKALKCLERHPWPGNIRELRSVIESAFIEARGDTIMESDLSLFTPPSRESADGVIEPYEGFDSKRYLDEMRDQLYRRALEITSGNLSAAARYLGITKQSLKQWNDKQSLRDVNSD